MVPKDLDKRAEKLYDDLNNWGHALAQDYLRDIKTEITYDYDQVKEHCSFTYKQRVQTILLLLDKYMRKP